MEEVHVALMNFMVDLGIAGIGLAAVFAVSLIKKTTEKVKLETNKIQKDEERQLIWEAIARLDNIATKTVMNMEQTIAKELREAVKDGRADKEELINLSKKAFKEIILSLKPEYLEVLEKTFGDSKQYIMSTIEAKVLEIKQSY